MALIFGNESEYLAADGALYNSIAALSETKCVVAYKDTADSDHGTAKIGTVSGTNITFGDEAEFYVASVGEISVITISPTKFVVVYMDSSNYGKAKVGTVSGTDITFGAEAEFRGVLSNYIIAATLPETDKFVVAYQSTGGQANIGTVSGTTITFGPIYQFNAGVTNDNSVVSLTSTKFVVAYRNEGDDRDGYAKIGTVSGTFITYDDAVKFNAGITTYIQLVGLDSTKFVVAYVDANDSDKGLASVGTVSGTTIAFSSEYEYLSTNAIYITAATLSSTKFVVAYRDGGDSGHGKAEVGTVAGTSITFGEATKYADNGLTNYNSIAVLSPTKFVVAYQDAGDSNHGTAKVGSLPIISGSSDLFIEGVVITEISTSGDLFTMGHEPVNANAPLYINGFRVTTKIYACGDNRNRSLGINGGIDRITSLQRAFGNLFIKYPHEDYPYNNVGDIEIHRSPTTAACTPTQGVCVDENGAVWSVGTNTDYALGIGSTTEAFVTSTPVRVSGLPDIPFAGVRIGDRISFAIAENGTVWGWGHNTHGELGIGNTDNQAIAQQVSGIINTIDIDVSAEHSVFITSSGVFACGNYTNSRLGISGIGGDVLIPQMVSGLSGVDIIDVACGDDTTMFVDTSGNIYFCGKNNHGLFGNGTAKNTIWEVPQLSVSGINCGGCIDITCDTNSSAYLNSSGIAHCAGYNRSGKFGNGVTTGDYINFIEVSVPSGHNVRAGDETTWLCCHDDASGVFAAGGTNYGEVGTTDGVPWTSWQMVPGSSGCQRMWGTEKQLVVSFASVERILNMTNTMSLYIAGPLLSSTSGDLFIHGYANIEASGDLFVEGCIQTTASGDLYLYGWDNLAASGDLFIHGLDNINTSGNLFIEGHLDSSGVPAPSLFIHGHEIISASGDSFIHGYDIKAASGNLFIRGVENTDDSQIRIIHRLTVTSDYSPQLISTFFAAPVLVNIEVWDVGDGQNTKQTIANSGCYQIGNTNKWGWSTEYLPFKSYHKKYHYYYRMTSNENEQEYGEFIITVPEGGRWSYPD